ncbi:hypothetical protein L3X38_032028 [Prunus dulcis]|uniref:Retrotransposon Copia-like N-terminal domain-containing protein n=1 Tax=Prunus dulcis TaxID=3755 RepID=A0AAD4YVJ0_PRUDU|nr:hypothetical protein L3X38_032028 [Prunus dulcis]
MEEEIKEKQEIMPIETPIVVEDFPKNEEQQLDSSDINAIVYLIIAPFGAIQPFITMPNIDAFISSLASGSTSPTASPTLIMMVHTESSTNLLLGFKLNGSNYAIWASMIELYATSQGKLGYLTRDSDAPDS